jgi:hypothetical protein
MSTSVAEMLDERDKKNAAIREALKLYPDLYIDGDYLVSQSLKPEDCDTIVVGHIDTPHGDTLRAGKQFEYVTVTRPFDGLVPMIVFWQLRREHPDLYAKLVQIVAKQGAR